MTDDILEAWKQIGRCAFHLTYHDDHDVPPCPSGTEWYCATHNPHGRQRIEEVPAFLPDDVFRRAYRLGIARSEAARERGGQHRFGWTPTTEEQRHVDGMSAVSEQLVALATGRRWTSDGLVPDAADAGDIEGGIAVRWTPYTNGHLIVHPDEPDSLRCVLVVGNAWPLQIVGWCLACDAKRPEHWRTNVRHPAFFVRPTRAVSELHASPTTD